MPTLYSALGNNTLVDSLYGTITLQLGDTPIIALDTVDTSLDVEAFTGSRFRTFDIFGNDLDNSIIGNDGSNYIEGRGGNDTLTGGLRKDALFGGIGDDVLNGGAGDDYLLGEDGDDTFTGGAGDDTINGGNGNAGEFTDTLVESADTDFKLTDFQLVSTATGTDTLIDINAASLTGGDSNNILDVSEFSGSFVTLDGGNGDDTLIAGAGDNLLIGGSGSDTYQLNADSFFTFVTITENADTSIDTIDFSSTTSLPVEVSLNTLEPQNILLGTEGFPNFQLTGQVEWYENLTGGAFNDLLQGNDINNTLNGNEGSDVLDGLGGADVLIGGFGDDFLIGGVGADTLTGGADADIFDYSTLTDSNYTNTDFIKDFDATNDLFGVALTEGLDVTSLSGDASSIDDIYALIDSNSTSLRLGANDVVIVTITGGDLSINPTGNTYVFINDSTSGVDRSTDALIQVNDITGITASNFIPIIPV